MRVRVLLKFAKILMLSRLRNTTRSFLSNSITNRPILIALIGSIMFVAGVGFGTATVSFLRGNTSAFLVLVVASVVAAFIGSVTVEILRALIARASTAFNKVAGRSMIILRILGVMLILLFTQTLFSGFLIIRIINSVSSTNAATILVPLLWPTLSITSLLRSNQLSSALFLLLSLGFLVLLSSTALVLRSRFWVATPPSFHFSNAGTISGVSRLRKIGVSAISLALVRREIRSATRR